MAEFTVTRDGDTQEDAVFDVDPIVDTANPFGDFAVIKMDDSEGEKFDAYPRGTRVDVSIEDDDATTYDRFTGYVVERLETEQSGADVLEVEAYSFDQFLRRNTVTNDQRGNTITEALADIIQTDTPVTYETALVEVGDDQELTRTYQGEAVETVLRDLAFKSNNEDFGVNDDLEFFFRERETTHIDRGIDNTQWFNYDIPELGKEAINEVEVWFDDGDESVIVDDGTDKLDLQDSLGLPDPGTQRAELNRPLITDINDAEDEGRKYLTFRNATLSGTVTTFGLFDARPGDTIDIEIAPRGIDDEFVIAAVEYRWGVDETILTIVEKRGDVDDILSELNESVQRVEMEGANRDAPKNRITTTDAGAIISVDVDADGNTPDDVRFLNNGRRVVRDAWTGDDPPDIIAINVGSDGTGLSRSNTSLREQTNESAAPQATPDDTTVFFEATLTQTDVQEVGLESVEGDFFVRATFDSPVDIDGAVRITLSVGNDDTVSRGVLTQDGQTAVRDILADTDPSLPNAYAYGNSDTAVSETDTALGNELVEVSLDEILIQNADPESEWESILDIPEEKPLVIDETGPRTAQIAWTTEAEDADAFDGGATVDPDDPSEFSGEDWIEFARDGDFATYSFDVEYNNTSDIQAQIRFATKSDGEGGAAFDAILIDPSGTEQDRVQVVGDGATLSSPIWEDVNQPAAGMEPGEWTLRLECTTSSTALDDGVTFVDVVAPYDSAFESDLTFDNTVNEDGFLDGPERYPELVEQSLSTANTRRNLTEANFESLWNDTSGEQYVELANDGSTFTRINNSDSGSVTFDEPERGVDVNIGFGRWSETSNQTPLNGNDPQQIDTWNLSANPDTITNEDIGIANVRAIAEDSEAVGDTFAEAGLKATSGDMLTRSLIPQFVKSDDQLVVSSERLRWEND